MTARSLRWVLVLGVVVLASVGWAATARGHTGRVAESTGGRLVVVSVPGLTWSEVAAVELPAFESVFDGAAMADLAPRGVSPRSGPGDAYLTISAGARATTSRSVDGQVLALAEQSGGSAADEIFSRRTGADPSGTFVSLSWPSLLRTNAARPYDAEIGLLAATLEDAGVGMSVIGNADGTDSIGASYERQVALAMASPTGVVDAGAITRELLVEDPTSPFGLRFDPDRVLERFDAAWQSTTSDDAAGVVLVEASDLARVMRYRALVSSSRYNTMRARAVHDTDRLLAGILERVDLDRDSVLVVAPYNLPGDRDLTAVALHRPGGDSGYLISASTQRAGYLTLVDIGPTILDHFGIDRPSAMEGRPAEVVSSTASLQVRTDHLITLNDASRFRERLLTPTTMVVLVLLAVLAAAGALALAGDRGPRWRRIVAVVALVDLALMPASYLARGLPLEELGTGVYWVVVLGVALGSGLISTWIGHRSGRPWLALTLVLAMVGLVLVGDVITGSHLSLNAAFGYSATGNSRLYGISNYSYGQVAAAACILGGILAGRHEGRSRLASIGLLCGILVVLGVPTWGADVGGVLAFTPTILVFGLLVYERRIRLRTVALGLVAAVLATVAFGLLDLARPPSERAHLGRLFERVGDEGLGPLFSIIQRKLVANLSVSTSSLWVAAIPIGLSLWVLIARHPTRPLTSLRQRIPTLGAGLVAAIVAAVLGSLLNDSGAIIGGVAAMVLTASVVHLLMVHEPVAESR
ncbi:MAG: hypothetical protein WD691_00645 [Acidimicrobiales bacterium]